MLVEIIIASVLAMSIAFYLLNLTYKFKDNSEDIYQSYNYMNDKILITKNIMSDLEKGLISGISYDSNSISFKLSVPGLSFENRKLFISEASGKTKIEYGEYDIYTNSFYKEKSSYYEKELETSLIVNDLIIDNSRSDSLFIKIPIQSIYNDEIYTIKLFANKN